MKVVFLFTNPRGEMAQRVRDGLEHDDHFFGMFRLPKYGVEATYFELESIFPPKVADFLRRHVLSMHFVHVPLLWQLRRYDAVITSAALGTLLLSKLLHIGPKKWIMYDYNISGQIEHAHTWKERLFRYLMGEVDGFIMLGQSEVEVMRARYPDKAMAFIPFGCDTAYFAPSPSITEADNVVLSVGRDPGRDWVTFLNAVKEMKVTVQTTARRPQLEKYGTLPPHVETHNFTPAELIDAYTSASMVVLPLAPKYPNDTMGCSTLVEAMAMGKAVIATDTAVMRDYITHGVNGILVPQGDVNTLCDAIQDLLTDGAKRRRLGQAARATVCSRCDADTVAKELAGYVRNTTGTS